MKNTNKNELITNDINISNKNNLLIISLFDELIKSIEHNKQYIETSKEIIVENFRIKNLKTAFKILKSFPQKITSSNDLKNIPGIGKGTLMRIDEILETGKLKEISDYLKLNKNKKSNQTIIDDLMTVVGIGPKIAMELINDYKIKSVNDLIKKVDEKKIELNDKILLGLKYYGKFEGKIPRKEITNTLHYLEKITDKYNPNLFIMICGSYRRELPFSSDIDVLLCSLDLITMDEVSNSTLLKDYVTLLKEHNLIKDDITNKNITTKYMGFSKFKNNPIRRIDIRLIPYESIFTAMLYFTGSYTLNQNMRKTAKSLGYKLSEYSLTNIETGETVENIESEMDIFKFLNMMYLSPKDRSI
jgi:DNA polymerase/3'-5' exonuclease PolX